MSPVYHPRVRLSASLHLIATIVRGVPGAQDAVVEPTSASKSASGVPPSQSGSAVVPSGDARNTRSTASVTLSNQRADAANATESAAAGVAGINAKRTAQLAVDVPAASTDVVKGMAGTVSSLEGMLKIPNLLADVRER